MNDSTLIELFRVLGDPVRWSVVSELRVRTRCACEPAEAPSLLSHHLGVLRDDGVVTASRRGEWIDDALIDGVLEHVAEALNDVVAVHDGGGCESGTVAATSERTAG